MLLDSTQQRILVFVPEASLALRMRKGIWSAVLVQTKGLTFAPGPRAADFDYDAFGTRGRKQNNGDEHFHPAGLYEKGVNRSSKGARSLRDGPRSVVAQVTRPEGGSEDTNCLHSDKPRVRRAVSSATGGVAEQTKRDPFGE